MIHNWMVFVIVLASLTSAFAADSKGSTGFYLDETFLPKLVDKNDTTSYTDTPGAASETGLGFDTKTTLGYVFSGSWFVGATYNSYSLTTSRSNRVGGDSGLDETTELNYLGPTLGWLTGGWRVMATAVISGEKVVNTKNKNETGITGNTKFTNKEASGMQLLLGYTYPVSSSFGIGPTLAYRSLTFAKQSKVNRLNSTENYSNTSLFSASTETNLDIMVSMVFRF
jgi:hypothetical protein